MADWDEDSTRLRQNLTQVFHDIRNRAQHRDTPTLDAARKWQADTMVGLGVPEPEFVGRFRGEAGVANIRVWVGGAEGVPPADVAKQLHDFEQRLQSVVAVLDRRYPAEQELVYRFIEPYLLAMPCVMLPAWLENRLVPNWC